MMLALPGWTSPVEPVVPARTPVPFDDGWRSEEPVTEQAASFTMGTDSESFLEHFIDQLENLTVKETWGSHIFGQVRYYREKKDAFGNKADFATASHVMRWYDKEGRCGNVINASNAIVLLAGANQGKSTTNILQACHKARMHIFEIQQRLFDAQFKRFRDSSLVKVHRKGWSDKIQQLQITLPLNNHETAGLFLPTGKWKNAVLLNETVETIPLADFVLHENLERISYVLIDVEGKEPNVIRGMNLESKRHIFPIFQYELGGTWTDSRHDENQWGQYGIAMYLKALGYKLFLIGATLSGQEKPILLQVDPEFFRFFSFRPEVDVGGNLLAFHPEFADAGLWEYLQGFVVVARPLEHCKT